MLITFEGIDGSGKSTQIRLLKECLRAHGVEPLALREPGGVPLSERIRALLLEGKEEMGSVTELLLFAASRAELMRTLVKPALERGEVVLLDRFCDSTTAYQGYGRGVDLDVIRQVNRIASLGIEPDLTFYLDLLPEDALIRKFSEKSLPLAFGENEIPLDRMESAGLEFYRRAREGYKALAREHSHRVVEIDALRSINDVHKQIVATLRQRVPQLFSASSETR
ncbi:MAG: dTMP kinase [Chloroherpetonaceae bacterium]|nr:dTMP kinase [Chloroherpetonaceae bacterium]MDW8438816.1 dTMP kinase [Chloroherpetonaceae bacterium]